MTIRLRLNPNPTEGTPPAESPPPAAPATPPPAAQQVTIPVDQLQQLLAVRADLDRLRAEQAAERSRQQQELANAQAARGEIEAAMRTVREQTAAEIAAERNRLSEEQSRSRQFALHSELNRALANQPLRPGAAPLVAQLLERDLQVHPEGNSYVVRTATFQSAEEHVRTALARPEFEGFLRPSNPAGGAGGNGGSQVPPTPPPSHTPPPPEPEPKNLGEALIRFTKEQAAAKKAAGGAAFDMGQRFGIGAGLPSSN